MGDYKSSNVIKIGPVGTELGIRWDDKGNVQIVQIFVSHAEEINSIQFNFAEHDTLVLSDRYGTNTGSKFDVVRLNYPDEYITRISGSHQNNKICSITFGTNLKEYGPFGSTRGKEFSFHLGEDHQFGGFYGTADTNGVTSIGVYLNPITTLDNYPPNDMYYDELTEESSDQKK